MTNLRDEPIFIYLKNLKHSSIGIRITRYVIKIEEFAADVVTA